MQKSSPVARFFQIIEGVFRRSAQIRGRWNTGCSYRYCDALTAATGFGWWVFPPTDLDLLWDGQDVFWHCSDSMIGASSLGRCNFLDNQLV